MNIHVLDASTGRGIPNAFVSIDVDFGNGTTRYTDGNGGANFGVVSGVQIGYSASASGYEPASGGPIGLRTHSTFELWLRPIAPPPPPPPAPLPTIGQTIRVSNSHGTINLTPLETDNNAATIEMHVHYIAPTGRFQRASCVRLWSDHLDWLPQQIPCTYGLGVGVAEDDYDYYAPPHTGTIASAYSDYKLGLPVRPPPPYDDPFRRTFDGQPCFDLQTVNYALEIRYRAALRAAIRDAGAAAFGCAFTSIGWATCVGGTFIVSALFRMELDFWEYKAACEW